MIKKLHIKEYINEPIKEPVEIIGHKYYDGSHSFILHSPIFDHYEYVNKLRQIFPEYTVSTTGHWDEAAVFAPEEDLRYVQQGVNKFNGRYCQHGKYNQEVNEAVEIDVKNTGVLEVPENKSVDELPIKHFVALANKKGLSTVTRALNNLQVWNKNKDPKLSKWAGDMIDKVTKRVENKKNESYENIHSYDYVEKDTIANNIADWVFEGDIDSNLCELEDLIGPLDMEDYEAPETLVDRLMTFDLDTLLYVESELNVQGIDESTHLEKSNQDEIDYRLECADYAIYHVVTNNTGIELISDNTNGKYELRYNGVTVEVEFNLEGTAKYEYTIDGEGPYVHNSYEYITNDIRDYINEMLDAEDL